MDPKHSLIQVTDKGFVIQGTNSISIELIRCLLVSTKNNSYLVYLYDSIITYTGNSKITPCELIP